MAQTLTTTVQREPTLSLQSRPRSGHYRYVSTESQSPVKVANLRLDPARALEPTRKKLTTLEAQRVMAVFEETLRRVEIVTLLPFILQNLERFHVSLGSELVELLKHHNVIISSYDDIRQELDNQLEQQAARRSKRSAAHSENFDELEPEAEGTEPGKTPVETFSKDTFEAVNKEKKEEDEERQRRSAASVQSGGEQSTDSQLEAAMRNLSLVAQQLSHSTRNILRAFTQNPAAVTIIIGEMGQRGPECQVLLQYLQELRDILMHKLLTTPEEEQERMTYLKEISKRERQNAVIIEKLEAELKEKNDDKEEEIRKKNEIIKRLQSDLHQIERFSEEQIRRMRGDAEKQAAADDKSSEGKRQKLQTEAAQLRSQLQNAIMEHRESEQELRSKKFKVETEVENWIQKYDLELGERQEEYEEIDAIYTSEKKQLHELEERFSTLEKEYDGIMDERCLAREKREKAERELAMMIKAATTVQAFWRSYKVRKALKLRKKKGKKGKKGPKGKKGK